MCRLTARAELRSSRVKVAGEGCLGIAVAASIATLNPNLNLPALPREVRRRIAARRYRPSSTAKKATDGTVGVRARCAVYSVWIAHPGRRKFQFLKANFKKTSRDTLTLPRLVRGVRVQLKKNFQKTNRPNVRRIFACQIEGAQNELQELKLAIDQPPHAAGCTYAAGLIWPSAVRPRRAKRAPPSVRSVASEASPTVRRPTGGERSELRRVTGHDFVRWILSYALGFVWVSFPRASS